MTFDKILVPLDGSLLAEAALPTAVELIGSNAKATLILLRAAEATTVPGVDPLDAQVAVVREAEDYLEAVAARLRRDATASVRTSVWYGAAAPSILEAARMAEPDVIIMSTHGRSGFCRLIRGSVAESVLRGSRTPVFLITAKAPRGKTPAEAADAREQEATNV
jgi:nucleotide-binding universal stress UspA family protein